MLRRTVYLVDDDAEIVANIATFLRDKHFDVRLFSNGDDFLAALPLSFPAVIILDMQMPKMSGLDIQGNETRHDRDKKFVTKTIRKRLKWLIQLLH